MSCFGHLKTVASFCLALAGAVGLVSAAHAQQDMGFKTPSDNIHCMVEEIVDEGRDPAVILRCDMQRLDSPPSPPPADCDLEWGSTFFLRPGDAISELGCVGDTVRKDEWPVLAYGSTWEGNGFSCISRRDGLTCTNPGGHGFRLSRAKQTLF